MAKNSISDEMGEDISKEFLGSNSLVAHAVSRLWENRTSAWFDDVSTPGVRETFKDMVVKSFRQSVLAMKDSMGSNPEKWKWGDIHALMLMHPLGKVTILDAVFNLNRGPFPEGGADHTVCPYSYDRTNPYMSDNGASQRHIFSTADWDMSLSVIPTGNCGVPASPYYCDQSKLYAANEYHPDFTTRERVRKSARFTMTLSGK
jgi:penicillin amidase